MDLLLFIRLHREECKSRFGDRWEYDPYGDKDNPPPTPDLSKMSAEEFLKLLSGTCGDTGARAALGLPIAPPEFFEAKQKLDESFAKFYDELEKRVTPGSTEYFEEIFRYSIRNTKNWGKKFQAMMTFAKMNGHAQKVSRAVDKRVAIDGNREEEIIREVATNFMKTAPAHKLPPPKMLTMKKQDENGNGKPPAKP